MDNTLFDTARAWAEHDPNPSDAAEIHALLDKGDVDELEKRFSGPLHFGTAGLRATLGAGESYLNTATVLRATSGLMAWLNQQVDTPRVVIGCDGRHRSEELYRAAAEAISGAGGVALMLPPRQPTPLTSFSVKELDADAGIMITASHNPPQDNGYKVYLGGRIATGDAAGVQIISPDDAAIATAIAAAPPADEIPRTTDRCEQVDTRPAYIASASSVISTEPLDSARDVTITLTAMHGVGGELAAETLRHAGFTHIIPVEEQFLPDPDFPTVAFPNPEEPGALDLALGVAARSHSDVIIALDPDADRLALAIPCDPSPDGWRQLTGDETGALLGDYLARKGAAGTFANSIVSGSLLGEIAQHYGQKYENTLTGFKWIGRVPELCFGYEEAIGFCVNPKHCSDKDGISATVVAASLVAELKAAGQTVEDRLKEFDNVYGVHRTAPLTLRFEDPQDIKAALEALLSSPPKEIAGSAVVETCDLSQGYRGLPPTPGLLLRSASDDGAVEDRIIVRPSGTEPKLKCYLQVKLAGGVGPADTEETLSKKAEERIALIKAQLKEALGV